MSTTVDAHHRTTALRRAAVRATLAPSEHNTQPWRFVMSPDRLDLYSDPARQLLVLDPTGRQMTISCGCALFNARVVLAAAGLDVEVSRLPIPADPTHLARIRIIGPHNDTVDPIGALDSVLELRQTNRRQFADDVVPADLLACLERAATAEQSRLFTVRSDDDRLTVAVLSQKADQIQNLNQAYRAELRAWTTTDPGRRDGVTAASVPHVDGHAEDEVPIRDFDSQGAGFLPSRTHSSRSQCLLLLGTDGDNPSSWVRAGEALERVLLEVARQGFAVSPLTQVVEVASARAELRSRLGLTWNPHILLRVGRAPITPSSHRRRLVDVLTGQP
ncbi:MAG: Acg family FMN-binding oxidoreductase [Jatrophihabitans sp.]